MKIYFKENYGKLESEQEKKIWKFLNITRKKISCLDLKNNVFIRE
jgi:hypothetical protein